MGSSTRKSKRVQNAQSAHKRRSRRAAVAGKETSKKLKSGSRITKKQISTAKRSASRKKTGKGKATADSEDDDEAEEGKPESEVEVDSKPFTDMLALVTTVTTALTDHARKALHALGVHLKNREEKLGQNKVQVDKTFNLKEFAVEGILSSRGSGKTAQYLVLWEGYKLEDSTWEPVRNMTHSKDLIKQYEAAKKAGKDGTAASEVAEESSSSSRISNGPDKTTGPPMMKRTKPTSEARTFKSSSTAKTTQLPAKSKVPTKPLAVRSGAAEPKDSTKTTVKTSSRAMESQSDDDKSGAEDCELESEDNSPQQESRSQLVYSKDGASESDEDERMLEYEPCRSEGDDEETQDHIIDQEDPPPRIK